MSMTFNKMDDLRVFEKYCDTLRKIRLIDRVSYQVSSCETEMFRMSEVFMVMVARGDGDFKHFKIMEKIRHQ